MAKGLTDCLGFRDTANGLIGLDHDEISNTQNMSVRIPGVNREMKVVNESGMYAMVMKSTKPEAKLFRKWITSEVLPAIRKTDGVYMTALSYILLLKSLLFLCSIDSSMVTAI